MKPCGGIESLDGRESEGNYIDMSVPVQVQVLKGPTFTLQLPPDSTISELRRLIFRETLVPPSNQHLILNSSSIIPEDGPVQSLVRGDTVNVKMVVTGLLPKPSEEQPVADTEGGRLFQLGWSLVTTDEGKKKINRIVQNRESQLQELESEALAGEMMSNPRFKELVTSPAFLSAVYYATHGEVLKPPAREEVKVQPPPRPPPTRISHEAAVEQLLEMGFERDRVEAALLGANDDVDQALQMLCG